MYERPLFTAKDSWEVGAQIFREAPLALLSSELDGKCELAHAPLAYDSSRRHLVGHFAGRNPQVAHVRAGEKVTAIFTAANSYVSPNWMAKPDVPTWNYATAYAYGTFVPAADFETAKRLLRFQSDQMEQRFNSEAPWAFTIPDRDPVATVMEGIQVFEIKIETLKAKLKMGQNLDESNFEAVTDKLRHVSPETAAWMQKARP